MNSQSKSSEIYYFVAAEKKKHLEIYSERFRNNTQTNESCEKNNIKL